MTVRACNDETDWTDAHGTPFLDFARSAVSSRIAYLLSGPMVCQLQPIADRALQPLGKPNSDQPVLVAIFGILGIYGGKPKAFDFKLSLKSRFRNHLRMHQAFGPSVAVPFFQAAHYDGNCGTCVRPRPKVDDGTWPKVMDDLTATRLS
jgi:hypothetical protein